MQKMNPINGVVARLLARNDAHLRQRLFGGELAYWRGERSHNQKLPDRHYCTLPYSERTMASIHRIFDELGLGISPSITRSGDDLVVILNHDEFIQMKTHLHPPVHHVKKPSYTDVATQTGFLSQQTYLQLEELLRDDEEAHVKKGNARYFADFRHEHWRCIENVRRRPIAGFADLRRALESIGQWSQQIDENGKPVADALLAQDMRQHVDTLSNWLGESMRQIYFDGEDKKLDGLFIQRLNQAVLAASDELPTPSDASRKHTSHLGSGAELLRHWHELPMRVKQNFTAEERYLFDHKPGAVERIAGRVEHYDDVMTTARALRREATAALGEEAMRPERREYRDISQNRIKTMGEGHGKVLRQASPAPDPETMPIFDRGRS